MSNTAITRYAYKNYQGAALYYAGSEVTKVGSKSKEDLYKNGGNTSVRVLDGSTSTYERGSEYTSPLYVPSSSGTSRKVALLSTSLFYSGGSITKVTSSHREEFHLRGDNVGSDWYKAGDKVTTIGTNATALTSFYVRDPNNDERVYRHNRDNMFDGSLYAPGTQHVELDPATIETETVTALTTT